MNRFSKVTMLALIGAALVAVAISAAGRRLAQQTDEDARASAAEAYPVVYARSIADLFPPR